MRARQSGLTLVELMVAMGLGLLLTVVIAQIFIGTRSSYATQEESARMQENARFALQLLERELRMAGFKKNGSTGAFDAANPALGAADGGGLNASDELTVRYFGSENPANTAPDGTVSNCIGEKASLNEGVVDVFYVATAPNGEPALFCRSRQPAAPVAPPKETELVTGVESLQILFGEDTNGDRTVDRYLPRGDAALNMDNVIALRISLLMRSERPVATEADARKYNHFGPSYAPGDVPPAVDPGAVFNAAGAQLDRRLRRIYQTTVALRNRL